MRQEAEVLAISWIPSEAIGGAMKLPFERGMTHYDSPPPDRIDDLEAFRDADGFRFANRLQGWADFDKSGRLTRHGFGARSEGMMGSTTVFQGSKLAHEFTAFAMPDLRRDPEVGDTWVRFVQTIGGRTGLPAPRRVRRAPFVQWNAPLVWTTLALTLHADGEPTFEVVGASRFPRHWVYGPGGELAAKVGMTDFKEWYRRAFGKHSPWGDEDSPALVTAAETALERQLSRLMMSGKPKVKTYKKGKTLVTEGEDAQDILLVLDGVIRAEKDGERLAEYGPGCLQGERAALDGGGRRTATLVAVTDCRVAIAPFDRLQPEALHEVSKGHRHEERRGSR